MSNLAGLEGGARREGGRGEGGRGGGRREGNLIGLMSWEIVHSQSGWLTQV